MFQVSSGPVAVGVSTTKTIAYFTMPSNLAAKVYKWWIASDATSVGTAASAIRVQVGVFNAAPTTATTVTPDKFDFDAAASNSQVAQAGYNVTVEGAGTPLRWEEHILGLTQSELIVWETTPRVVQYGENWRIRVITPAGIATTNLYAGMAWTE